MVGRLLRQIVGKFLNTVGTPGFIQARECHDRLGVPIEIRVDDMFTTIMVHNVRLMFHRLTGGLDGIVLDPVDCRAAAATHGASEPPG